MELENQTEITETTTLNEESQNECKSEQEQRSGSDNHEPSGGQEHGGDRADVDQDVANAEEETPIIAEENGQEEQTRLQIFREKAEKMGRGFEDVLQELFSAHEALEKNPAQAIEWLKQQYGGVSSEKADITNPVTNTQGDVKILADLYALRDARDEKGQLKYPHFESLERDVLQNLQSGKALDAPNAYEMAFWSNQNLRAKHLKEIEDGYKLQAQEEVKLQQAAVADAKNVKTQGVTATSGENKGENIRQTMSAIYDELVV